MDKLLYRKMSKSLVRQFDQADCGVCCLLTVIRYHGGDQPLSLLRDSSGTGKNGATLLGLKMAGRQVGLDCEGYKADISTLFSLTEPSILHVVEASSMGHFVVCIPQNTGYQNSERSFIIGDPAKGVRVVGESELSALWVSGALLIIAKGADFTYASEVKRLKRKWILDLVNEDRGLLYKIIAVGVLVAILNLTLAVFYQRLIDHILPSKSVQNLVSGLILLLIILGVKEVLSMKRQQILLSQASSLNSRMTSAFMSRLLDLPKSFFDRRKIGDLTARMNDVARIQRVVGQLVGSTCIDALVLIAILGAMFSYSWQIGLICMLPLLVFPSVIAVSGRSLRYRQQLMMAGYAQSEANYISTLMGIDTVKGAALQQGFLNRYQAYYQRYQHAVLRLGGLQIKISFLLSLCSLVFLVIVLAFSSYLVFRNELSLGGMMAILSLSGTLLPLVVGVAGFGISFNEARIAFERMFEFAGLEPEKDNEVQISILQIDHLLVDQIAFRFNGQERLLLDVSFEVSKGEVIAVVGQNGSGKSTILQLLQRHYLAEEGCILVNQEMQLKDIRLADWRTLCAEVPQSVHIFNASFLENVGFEDSVNDPGKVVRFLEEFGFDRYFGFMPESWMTLLGEDGVSLSGGQKQMLGLARAIYRKPQLLLLDEVTAAMDAESEQFVVSLLRRLRSEMAIVFITHRLHIVRALCDRIYILDGGVISSSGTHHGLLRSPNLYSRYWKELLQDG